MKLNVKEIKQNPDNPRLIKDDKFKKLVQSLKDFPVMTDLREVVLDEEKMIIGGNMRFKAAIEAGWEEIPVKIFTREMAEENNKLTEQNKTYEEYRQEFIVKDNISGGEWDWDVLANHYELEELDAWGLDLPKNMEDGVTEEDSPPDIDLTQTKSELGQLYQLGNHRVMCGNATEEEHVNILLGKQKVDLYLTDPPYNVDYTGKTKEALKIDNDQMDDEVFRAFLADAFRRADEHMKSGSSFYIFHADSEGFNFRAAVKDVGWLLKQNLVWIKNSMVMGRQDYQWRHEPILYGWKSGASHSWYADRKQTTILEFDRPTRSTDHPTMKPINILAYLIRNSSKSGDVIYDSFSGSGSGLMACEQMKRTFYGMELDPKYVDVIRKRYAKYMNNNELPDNWEELTPVVDNTGEKEAS